MQENCLQGIWLDEKVNFIHYSNGCGWLLLKPNKWMKNCVEGVAASVKGYNVT